MATGHPELHERCVRFCGREILHRREILLSYSRIATSASSGLMRTRPIKFAFKDEFSDSVPKINRTLRSVSISRQLACTARSRMVNCENENGLARLFLSEAVSVAGGGETRGGQPRGPGG